MSGRRRPPLYERGVRPLLFRLDAERAHELALRGGELAGRHPLGPRLAHACFAVEDPRLEVDLAGLRFANPLGLAAGFDKNARALPLLAGLGFGHLEMGSVSAWPSAGNERPRLFRLPGDEAVVVSYGVPNDGAQAIAARVGELALPVPLGINLVKTNDPARPAVEPEVYEDYARSFAALQDGAGYVALNMSCPNSAADRDFFDDLQRIERLLSRLAACEPRVPVFLKLKPTLDSGVLRETVAIAAGFPFVAGFSINLPAGKPAELALTTATERLERMPGAVGGRPVEAFVNEVLRRLRAVTGDDGRFAIMAAGGVFDAAGARRKLRLGASLVQVYTGLVYRGPGLVREILEGLLEGLEADGARGVGELVGADA